MKKYAPYLIVLAAVLWSLDGLLRRNLYSLPSTVIVFLEHLLGLIVLSPFLIREFKNWRKQSKKTWLAVLVIALLGGTVGTIAYTAALGRINYINFSVVVLLQQLQPVFAITLSAILLKEKISRHFIFLAVLAIIAAYFVSFPDLSVDLATGQGTVIAAILAATAAFAWGVSTVLGRYALNTLNFMTLSGLRFFFTAIFAFMFLAITRDLSSLAALTSTQWWYVIAIVFSTGLVALLIYYKGLSHVPARVSTILEMAWPVSAIVIDWLFFKNTLSATQWVGAIALIYVIMKISTSRNESAGGSRIIGPES